MWLAGQNRPNVTGSGSGGRKASVPAALLMLREEREEIREKRGEEASRHSYSRRALHVKEVDV